MPRSSLLQTTIGVVLLQALIFAGYNIFNQGRSDAGPICAELEAKITELQEDLRKATQTLEAAQSDTTDVAPPVSSVPVIAPQQTASVSPTEPTVPVVQPAAKDKPITEKPLTLRFPPDAAARGAVCMDGRPAGYYWRRGEGVNATKWVLWLEGGGWCYTKISCEERRGRLVQLGTMKDRPKKRNVKMYFGSGDIGSNPDFHSWSHVLFVYCDGTSFLGNVEKNSSVFIAASKEWRPLYLRGYRVLQAELDDLFNNNELGKATEVIIGGHSAGGMAALIHIDQIRERFPPTTRVTGLVDAGLFVDYRNGSQHGRTHCRALEGGFTYWNATGLHPKCLAAFPPDEQWKCIFPGYLLPFISTPIFMIQDQYDNWATKNMLGVTWLSYDHHIPENQMEVMKEFGRNILHGLEPLKERPTWGLWLSSCQMAIHGEITMPYWIRHKINGRVLRDAYSDWYFGRCSEENNNCRWSEQHCDWTEVYKNNHTLAREGKINACIEEHPDKRIGSRLVFRGLELGCLGHKVVDFHLLCSFTKLDLNRWGCARPKK